MILRFKKSCKKNGFFSVKMRFSTIKSLFCTWVLREVEVK